MAQYQEVSTTALLLEDARYDEVIQLFSLFDRKQQGFVTVEDFSEILIRYIQPLPPSHHLSASSRFGGTTAEELDASVALFDQDGNGVDSV